MNSWFTGLNDSSTAGSATRIGGEWGVQNSLLAYQIAEDKAAYEGGHGGLISRS